MTQIPSISGAFLKAFTGSEKGDFPVEMFAGPVFAAGASKLSNVAIENLGQLTPNITTAQAPVITQSVGQGAVRTLKG